MFSTFRKRLLSVAAGLVVAFAMLSAPPADAGAISAYLLGKFYGVTVQGTAFTAPTTVYVALATGTFTAQACTTEVSTTSTGYARVAVTANTTNFVVTSGVASNGTIITFGTPTASWGTVNQFCLYDASTGGNLLLSAALTSSQAVSSGQAAPSFAVGALTWTIN